MYLPDFNRNSSEIASLFALEKEQVSGWLFTHSANTGAGGKLSFGWRPCFFELLATFRPDRYC